MYSASKEVYLIFGESVILADGLPAGAPLLNLKKI
jgi:hypothetical protein